MEELEELQHNDLFYWTDNNKEVFEKRFNEITEEIKKKQELFTLQLVNKINSANSLEELESLGIPDEDIFKIPYNDKKKKLEEYKKERDLKDKIDLYFKRILFCKTISELQSIEIEDIWDVKNYYETRLQFLEQQEELNKIKAEQEEKRKLEEQEKL